MAAVVRVGDAVDDAAPGGDPVRRVLRSATALVKPVLLAGVALLFGGAGALFLHIDSASGTSTDPGCTYSGGTLSIDLFGSTVSITDDGTNFVVSPSSSCPGPYPVGGVTSISFSVDGTATTASTVILDQTNHEFPCVPIGGTVGNMTAGDGTVRVTGADGESLTVGDSGVNMDPGTCDSSVGTLSGVGTYLLDDSANSGAVILSAGGGAGTGSAASVTVEMTSGGAANTFVAGDGVETFAQTGKGVGDALDFSQVFTSSSAPLAVNASGGPHDGSASVGSIPTYSFTPGSAAFDSFTGATTGNTTFLASGAGGDSFSATGSNDAIDFSAAASGVNANLSSATEHTLLPGEVGVPGGVDTISGLTTVTGSAAGGNSFYAGSSGPYTFTGNGNNNVFYGGSGTDTFGSSGTGNRFVVAGGDASLSDSAGGNTVDFSALTVPLTVNVSGVLVGSTASDTATTASATYTLGGLTAPTTFIGATPASGGTTFDAGADADTFEGQGLAADTLTYTDASGSSLAICTAKLSSGTCAAVPIGSTGVAVLGTSTEPFSGIAVLGGLAGGNTTFISGSAGGYTFNATNTGNVADFSAATSGTPGVSVDLSVTPATVNGFASGGPDTMTGITSVTGSAAGGNTFRAGAGNETFSQTGSGVGDALDLSHVSTSATTPMTVDVSGGSGNDTASVGSTTYTFTTGGAAFTAFTGPSTGSTTFLASGSGGYSFTASGSSDSIDFSAAASGVNVNLSPATEHTLASGEVGVAGGVDVLSGLSTVTGSTAGGNSFYAGSGGPYVFTGNGNDNTFTGGTGTDSFTSNGSGNRFVAGTGNAVFNDTSSENTIDFSALTVPLTVNVSGSTAGTTVNDTATTTSATYSFTGVSAPTTFIGATPSSGGTTFDAGTDDDTFDGQGLAGDTLSYAHAPGASLTLCMAKLSSGTCAAVPAGSTGAGVLGATTQPFSGITIVDGLAAGNTTFVSGAVGGNTFNATNTGNTADFSAATGGVSVDLRTSPATVTGFASGGPDTMTGIAAVTGSSAGGNTFRVGTGDETFAQAGSGVGDAVDLSQVPTSASVPLLVNVSGTGPGNDTASTSAATYTFTSGGAAFTAFTGASTGYTTFAASGGGGYSFTASGSHDSIDFSAAASGVNVNLSPATEAALLPGEVGVPGGVDVLSGLSAVTGSAAGGNRFYAGSAGPYTFTGNGDNNVFTGGSGADVFASHGTGNHFVAGTGSASFSDPAAGNTVDFSALAVPVTVNLSGTTVGVTDTGTATTSSATYNFTGLTGPTTFIGATPSTGGTTFYAGSDADTFQGQAQGGDTLSYAHAPGSPLTLCLAHLSNGTCAGVPAGSTGEAVLGSVVEPFSGISVLDGLGAGNTTFVSGAAGGFQLDGQGTNNTLDLSAAPAGAVVTVNGDSLASPGTVTGLDSGAAGATVDTFAGIQTFKGPVPITSAVQAVPSTLRRMTMDARYWQQLSGAGGTVPYGGWAIESGLLPSGITLSTTGLLSGEPTATGTFSFVVSLVDAHGTPGATSYTVTVGSPRLEMLPFRLPAPVVGTPYSVSLRTLGGTAPYTYAITSGALPPGLTLDPTTGAISGTPTTAGRFSLVVTVTDSSASPGPYTASRRYTLVVKPG